MLITDNWMWYTYIYIYYTVETDWINNLITLNNRTTYCFLAKYVATHYWDMMRLPKKHTFFAGQGMLKIRNPQIRWFTLPTENQQCSLQPDGNFPMCWMFSAWNHITLSMNSSTKHWSYIIIHQVISIIVYKYAKKKTADTAYYTSWYHHIISYHIISYHIISYHCIISSHYICYMLLACTSQCTPAWLGDVMFFPIGFSHCDFCSNPN